MSQVPGVPPKTLPLSPNGAHQLMPKSAAACGAAAAPSSWVLPKSPQPCGTQLPAGSLQIARLEEPVPAGCAAKAAPRSAPNTIAEASLSEASSPASTMEPTVPMMPGQMMAMAPMAMNPMMQMQMQMAQMAQMTQFAQMQMTGSMAPFMMMAPMMPMSMVPVMPAAASAQPPTAPAVPSVEEQADESDPEPVLLQLSEEALGERVASQLVQVQEAEKAAREHVDANSFIGTLARYDPELGFGFVICPECVATWGKSDIYIGQKNFLESGLDIGDVIAFHVEDNNGKPRVAMNPTVLEEVTKQKRKLTKLKEAAKTVSNNNKRAAAMAFLEGMTLGQGPKRINLGGAIS